ncbi:unnamed protein product [Ectocarpus sp. 4 AP-2014]
MFLNGSFGTYIHPYSKEKVPHKPEQHPKPRTTHIFCAITDRSENEKQRGRHHTAVAAESQNHPPMHENENFVSVCWAPMHFQESASPIAHLAVHKHRVAMLRTL